MKVPTALSMQVLARIMSQDELAALVSRYLDARFTAGVKMLPAPSEQEQLIAKRFKELKSVSAVAKAFGVSITKVHTAIIRSAVL